MNQEIINKLSINTFVYFLGNISTKLVSFLLLPLYTRKLSPSDYGYFDLITTAIDLVVSIIFLEIWQGILRFLIDERKAEGKNIVFSTGIVLVVICSLFYTFSFYAFVHFIHIEMSFLVYLLGLLSALMNFLNFVSRGINKNFLFALSGILNSVVFILLNIFMILFLRMGISALLISSCIAKFTSILIIFCSIRRTIIFSIKHVVSSYIIKILKYSLPLIVNSISYWLLNYFNRWVIFERLGIESNGLFAVAYKFAGSLNILTSMFLLSWQEVAFILSESTERGEQYSIILNRFIKFLIDAIIVLIPASFLIYPIIVAPSYIGSKYILPIFYMGTIAGAISNFLGHLFGAEKNTNLIFYTTMSGSAVSIFVILTTIPYIGMYSAVISLLAGYVFTIVLRYVFIKKKVFITLELKQISLCVGLLGVSSLVFYSQDYLFNLIAFILFLIYWLFSYKNILVVLAKILVNYERQFFIRRKV